MAADFCCATLELAVIDHLRQQGANHLPLPFVTLADQQAAEMLADIL